MKSTDAVRTKSLILLTLLFPLVLRPQELDCEVTINTQQLTSDALENLSDFADQIRRYLNGTKWTGDDFGNDRIKCSINIFFQSSPGEGRYIAQAFIGSQRKIWDLKKNRPLEKASASVRIFDDKWEFSYTRGIALTRNEFRFDPLTSFLDFYAYLILGFDYDSYELMAGTPHFQKALDIFNLSRSARAGRGWEFPGSGSYSRTRLIDELMNPQTKSLREAIYKYHSQGLDRLTTDRSKALENIMEAAQIIGNIRKKVNPQSIAVRTFFDTKYLELCELFLDHPDPDVYLRLSAADPSHQKSYEEYRLKRKDQ